MENIIAASGGATAGVMWDGQAQIVHSFGINWAETFQVCWKAAIGALAGLIVKAVWDWLRKKYFKSKHNNHVQS